MSYEASDEERILVEESLKGNREFQKRLFERYYGKMLGVSYRYTESEQDARDILQDAYIKVFQSLSAFSFTAPLEAWIRRIVINTAIDRFRKNASLPDMMDVEEASGVTSNDNIISHLSHQELLGIINTLPAGYKIVFNMFAIEGYSHKEIAETLGITEGTSKSQFSKARMYLQKIISKQSVNRDGHA